MSLNLNLESHLKCNPMLSRNEQLLLDLKKNLIDNILCSLKFKRLTQRLGLHVTRAKYYSSTPTINDLENHYRINGDVELYNNHWCSIPLR